MVKDHSDSERGNLLPSHGLLYPIRSIQKNANFPKYLYVREYMHYSFILYSFCVCVCVHVCVCVVCVCMCVMCVCVCGVYECVCFKNNVC